MGADTNTEWWRPAGGLYGHAQAGDHRMGKGESTVPFRALMAFTFILLIAPQQIFPVLAPLRIALLTAAVAVVSILLDRFTRRQSIMPPGREMWIVVCLAGWAVATAPLSYWPGGSISFLLEVYFKTLIVFWLLCNVVDTVSKLQQTCWCLTLIALPLAVTGIVNYMSGAYLDQGDNRIMGYNAPLTANPNDLALMLNLILPLSIALFLGSIRTSARILLACCIVLLVTAIFATFSRAGFLTLSVIFAAYLWMLRKRPECRFAVAVLVIVLAAAPFLPTDYVERLGTITNIEADRTGAAQARWNDTLAAAKFVMVHPVVGAGIGQNILALNEVRGEMWKEIHNVYLQYAVDLGLPGLVLFLMLLTASLKSTHAVQRGWESGQDPGERRIYYLAEGIRVSLFAFVIAAFFHPVAYHFYFYYIAGLAIALKTVSRLEQAKRILDVVGPRQAG